jgi:YVTN family beta-propeller protein
MRIPAGGGAHGVVPTPSGKVFVTNTNDNNVTVIEAASGKVITTLAVGTNPNGLTFVPNT